MSKLEFQRLLEFKKDQIISMLQNQVQTLSQQLHDYHRLKEDHQELQESFHNNLKVIEELQEYNQIIGSKATELKCELDQVHAQYLQLQRSIPNQMPQEQQIRLNCQIQRQDNTIRRDAEQIAQLKQANASLIGQLREQKQQLQHRVKLEIQKTSQLAAQTIAAKQSQSQKAYFSLKAQTDRIIHDLKLCNGSVLAQNKVLAQTIASLKEQNLNVSHKSAEGEQRLQRLLKEQQFNAEIFEKQMDNQKSSHETFQATLKDKLKSLQLENEKLLIEKVDGKNESKARRKQLKDQFNKRFQQLSMTKDQQFRKLQELVKQLQIDNKNKEFTVHELRKQQMELEKLKRSKNREADDKNNFYAKALEEDKRQFKNQLSLKDSKIDNLNFTVQSLEKDIQDKTIIVNQLRARVQVLEQKQRSKTESEDQLSIRESDWEFDKRVPKTSLETLGLKKEIQEMRAQNQQLRRAVTITTQKAREDCNFSKQRLDLKEKEGELLREDLRLTKLATQEKTQQVNKLNDQVSSHLLEIKRLELAVRESQHQKTKITELTTKLTQQLRVSQLQLANLNQQVDVLNEERQALIQISNQLRAELEFSKDHTGMEGVKRISISNISKISDEPRNIPMTPSILEAPEIRPQSGFLFDMIRQKNRREKQFERMEITAKQTPIHEQTRKMVYQQTQSQKESFQRMKSRSKSPNRFERGDRRPKQNQTESQKLIYQKIKRQNLRKKLQNETPRIGANYNRLRDEWIDKNSQDEVEEEDS